MPRAWRCGVQRRRTLHHRSIDSLLVICNARPPGSQQQQTSLVNVLKAQPGRATAGVPGTDVEIGGGSPVLEPDRGNPTSKRQGRGPELTGRFQCGQVWRCGASVRAGLKEAVDASWWRTKVKRRKAFLGGASRPQRRCPIPIAGSGGVVATRSRRNLSVSPWEICWVPAGLAGRPEDEEDDG